MPKTTVDLPSEVLAQLEKLQKEKGFEYLKDAYLYALKHGLDIMENNIEKGIEQRIQIREPIAEPINAEEPSETQIPPCPYASLVVRQNKNGLEYLAYCDNPKKTNLPRDRLLPCIACQKCWKREHEKEIQIQATLKELHAKGMRVYFCEQPHISQQHYKHISELPCIKNPEFQCDEKGAKMWTEDESLCPLFIHKEWRKLLRENISEIL